MLAERNRCRNSDDQGGGIVKKGCVLGNTVLFGSGALVSSQLGGRCQPGSPFHTTQPDGSVKLHARDAQMNIDKGTADWTS
jgi:hypothetical protein